MSLSFHHQCPSSHTTPTHAVNYSLTFDPTHGSPRLHPNRQPGPSPFSSADATRSGCIIPTVSTHRSCVRGGCATVRKQVGAPSRPVTNGGRKEARRRRMNNTFCSQHSEQRTRWYTKMHDLHVSWLEKDLIYLSRGGGLSVSV